MGRSTADFGCESAGKKLRDNISIVPGGTDILSYLISRHFVLGYFHFSLRFILAGQRFLDQRGLLREQVIAVERTFQVWSGGTILTVGSEC
jgi:hypothetical protein